MNGVFTSIIAAGVVLTVFGVLPMGTFLILLVVGAFGVKQMKIK